MRKKVDTKAPSLFDDESKIVGFACGTAGCTPLVEPDLMAAIADATQLEQPAPVEAAHVEPPPRVSALEREQKRRREKLDHLIHTPSVFDAIAKTSIECSNAGYGVLSIGILGDDTLIVKAHDGADRTIEASGSPRTVIDTLRTLIVQSRAQTNGNH